MQNLRIGYLYVCLAASFFAVIGVIGKDVINAGISPLDLLVIQYAVTVVIILAYFLIKDIRLLKLNKTQLKNIIIQGVIGSSGTTIFYFLALEKVSAGIASMLLFTHPALISIYFLLTRTKKINILNNIALLLAISGSALVINIFAFDMTKTPAIGLIFGMLASVSYAFFNIFAEYKLKDVEPMTSTFYGSLIILIISLAFNPEFLKFNFSIDTGIFFYIVELSIISGILPVVFLYKGIAIVGADRASIVATAELPITVLLAFLILGEKMNAMQMTGIIFIIVSIILLQNENNILLWHKKIRK